MKSKLILIPLMIMLYSCADKEVLITPLKTLADSSMRGLYSVDEKITWASGSNGYVLHTTDNENWLTYQDTSWSGLDFRDIHAFNEKEAIIMSSGDGCKMYKTFDGSKSWDLVYENNSKGIFFDGMDFWDETHGIAFSDPIDNRLYIIETKDGGNSWSELKSIELPKTLDGEAGFAASGTGIVCSGDGTVFIGSGGGAISRVFVSHNSGKTWDVIDTPMMKGEASGIYSMTFLDELHGVAVGGNYLDSANTEGNCIITSDGGLTWERSLLPPTGYRSGVCHNGNGVLIATGRNGIDVSFDKGINWKHVTDDAYYSCVMNGDSGWLTGRNGKMAKIQFK